MLLGSFPDLVVADVARSVAFYRAVLDLDVLIDHGWYAELGHAGRTHVAFVRTGHDSLPARASTPPTGVLITFDVDDAAAAHRRATAHGCQVELDLTAELGQRHFMIRDPDHAIIDIVERIPLTNADLRRLAAYRRHTT